MPLRTLAFLAVLFATLLPCNSYAQDARDEQPVAKPSYRYWSTSWKFDDIDIRDLVGKLKSVGIEIPVEITGRASVNFDVGVPINGLRTAKAYRFRGTISAKNLTADQAEFETLGATVNFDDGVLALSDLRGTQADGLLSGSAKFALLPRGDFESSVELESFDAAPIASLLTKFGIGSEDRVFRALVDADVDVAGKVDELETPLLWNMQGDMTLSQMRVGDSKVFTTRVNGFSLKDQRVSLSELLVQSAELPEFFLVARGEAGLDATGDFKFQISANDLPAADLLGLYFDSPQSLVDGKLDIQGSATGSFVAGKELPEFDLKASVASPSVQVAGLDLGLLEHDLHVTDQRVSIQPRAQTIVGDSKELLIKSASASYLIDEDALTLSDLDLRVFGGTVNATAKLSRNVDGVHVIDSSWDSVEPKFSIQLVPGAKRTSLSGRTSGQIDWRVPADKLDSPQFHQGTAKISIDPLRLGSELLGSMRANVAITEGAIEATGDGNLFGGRVTVKTVAPLNPQTRWKNVADRLLGAIKLDKTSIGKTISAFYGQRTRFDGLVSGEIRFERAPGQPFKTRSNVTFNRFETGRVLVARDLKLDIESADADLTLRSLRGSYAGGRVDASGKWSLLDGQRLITVRLVRSKGEKALLPINAEAEQWLGGTLTGRASIVGIGAYPFGNLRITGALEIDDTVTFGLPVGDARTPFVVQVALSPLRWSADFHSIRSSLAGGQVAGRLRFSNAISPRHGFNMASDWRVNHVDFEKLLSAYVGSTTIGRGNVTGDFDIGGRNIRSANDLKGQYRVALGGTDATALPGFSQGSLLGATALAGTRFSQGESAGRITRGSVVIDHMVMTSDQVAFEANGRVAIRDKRVNLNAVLATGNFDGQSRVFSQLGTNAVLNYLPIGQINQIVSDRTVAFEMSGPLRDPIIRLLPAKTLQLNARRLLVQEIASAITVDSLLIK